MKRGGFACLLAAMAAWSQELSLRELMQVKVVSASKQLQDASQAPAKVIVITAEEIQQRGYLGLDEIFRDLAGMDITGGRSVEWSTIFMRGMRTENTDRFLLIWDGIVQNDPWKYNVWLSRQYPLSNIDRIEVMYGPGSLLYGTNAFAGLVNVILKRPGEVDGVSAWAQGGAYNTRLAEANFGKVLGDWRLMANARWFTSDEMDVNEAYWVDRGGRKRYYNFELARDGRRDPSQPSGFAPGLKVWDGVAHWSVDGADVPFSGRAFGQTRDGFLQIGAGYGSFELKAFLWSRQESQDLWYVPLRTLQTPWTPTGSALDLSHRRTFSLGFEVQSYLRTRHGGLDSERSYAGNFTRTITNNAADPNNLTVSSLNAVLRYRLFGREWRAGQQFNLSRDEWEAVLGWEYLRATTQENYGTRTLPTEPWSPSPTHDERNAAAFASLQVRPTPHLSLSTGLRYDYNALAGEKGGFGHLYTGRMACILTPREGHRFMALYGQAYQAPSPWHKFSTVRGDRELRNPFLKPERLSSLELVYEVYPAARWRAALSAYYNVVSDLITSVTVPYGAGTTHQHQNTGSLRIFGQELESRLLLGPGSSLFLNATWSRTKVPETGAAQPDLAPFKANAGLEFAWRSWQFSLRGHYVAARETAAAGSTNLYSAGSAPGNFTADLALTWREPFPRADLRIGFHNLLNRRTYDPGVRTADGSTYNSLIIQPGFRMDLGLTCRF